MSNSEFTEIIGRPRIQEIISAIGGRNAIDLLELMITEKKGAIDEVYAEKLSLKITEIRTILNRLHYRGLVEYQKTRDEKSGWYTYTWGIKKVEIANLLKKKLQEELEKYQEKLQANESYMMFSCSNDCHKVPFEIAAEYEFRCPDCTEEMKSLDEAEEAEKIRDIIDEIGVEIANINRLS
ncbi:MAG: hypothetical protein JXA43_03760 [Candidatus Diapherotrites archaeon]|nr:hypothetical protein [Candidatus Diapherotrites archaeon]